MAYKKIVSFFSPVICLAISFNLLLEPAFGRLEARYVNSCMPVHLPTHQPAHLPAYLRTCLLPVCPSTHSHSYMYTYLNPMVGSFSQPLLQIFPYYWW